MKLIKYIFRVIEVALEVLNIISDQGGGLKPKLEDFDIDVKDVHTEENDIVFTLSMDTVWRIHDVHLTDEVISQLNDKKSDVIKMIREKNKYTKK